MSRMFYEVGAESEDTKNKFWSLSFLTRCLSLLPVNAINNMTRSDKWRKGLMSSYHLESIRKEIRGTNLERVTETEVTRKHRLPVYLPWFSQFAFHTIQDQCPEVVPPTVGWDLPQQSEIKKMPPHTWLQDNLIKIFSQLGFCLLRWLKGMDVLEKWQTLGMGLKGRKMKWRPLVVSEKQRRPECLQWPNMEQFEYREIQTTPDMNHWIKSDPYTNTTF